MAKSKEPEKVDVLSRFATANDAAVGYINRVDAATAKFRKSQRRGSIVKAAQGNLFEFPVFVSNTIPVDFATATVSLLEQIYATYLQMAISINPVIDADSVKRGVQFANYKTNTNKYLEYVDTSYQRDVCHAEYINEDCKVEFDLLSIEDSEAKLINEAYDYQPLSEFDHFFQEAITPASDINGVLGGLAAKLYPLPAINGQDIITLKAANGKEYNVIDPNNVSFGTAADIRDYLISNHVADINIDKAIANLDNTNSYYHIPELTAYTVDNVESTADKTAMGTITSLCGMLTPEEFAKPDYDVIRKSIDDLDQRNPGFRIHMDTLMAAAKRARDNAQAQVDMWEKQAANFESSKKKTDMELEPQGGETPEDYLKNLRLNAKYQQQKAAIDLGKRDHQPSYTAGVDAMRRKAVYDAKIAEDNAKTRKGQPSNADYIDAMRRRAIDDAKLAKHNASGLSRTLDTLGRAGQAANQWASAANAATSAATNIASFRSTVKGREADARKKQWEADHLDETNAMRKTDVYSRTKTSNIQYVRDADCQKLNTMKPLLMKVTLNMLNKDDSLQPIEYIIGVKTHTRMVQASILPEVAKYPLKEMDKISRKIKWRAGELKFFKDLVFRIKEKKQTAADSRDPNRKWYRRLYELAHMQGDAPAAAVVEGKSLFKVFIKDKQGKGNLQNGMIPNASIIMSQADVDNIKAETEIDLLKPSAAKKFCGELFLMSLIIIDTDRDTIKILLPDINNDYDVHSLASVNRQLAQLDTMGTKTRDMFKMLGA